jgi:hypothetical protein
MYKGGPSYTPQSAKAIRYAGLIVPVILIIYGLFIRLDRPDNLHYFGDLPFIAISFWWLLVGIIQFMDHSKSKRDSALRLIGYHLLAGAYLLLQHHLSPFGSFCYLLVTPIFHEMEST